MKKTVCRTARRAISLTALLLPTLPFAATFTVSKDGRGAYTTITDALAHAGKLDIIEILDAAVYPEQVTIDSAHSGLTLRSSNPTAIKKPTILYQDRTNVGPTTAADSKIDSKINFDQNGALRIMRAHNVTIDGIAVDGGGAYPFAYAAIWNAKDALFHGNGGIDIWISGDVTIRNCDVKNAYMGINVKDRNEGGIFANANPADLQPWNVVPLSGFARTGNHLFEKNRIHNNSWGMFFESAWDLGSNIRYNLFYENHHTPALSAQIVKMPDGQNQPGGALFFKDVMLTPIAIYNNTFYHNYLIFAAHWRAGAQHLIFNNIYAAPFQYWKDNVQFPNPFQALDPAFVNRMKNCLYAAQGQPPEIRSQGYNDGMQDPGTNTYVPADTTIKDVGRVAIMNQMDQVKAEGLNFNLHIPLSTGTVDKPKFADWVTRPGAPIVNAAGKAFPAEANIRWYEIKFKNTTDSSSPDFLAPDYDDTTVQRLVKDAGWPLAGVRDADGSIADLGAIPSGGIPSEAVILKPLTPVLIQGTTATINFSIIGKMDNPKIKMLGWVNRVDFQPDAFGGTVIPLPPATDMSSQVAGAKITSSGGTFTLTVPTRSLANKDLYAFAEMTLEGTSGGKPVVSTVGFMPFRLLNYAFLVEILDVNGKRVDSLKAGEGAFLKVTPQTLNGVPFNNTVSPVSVSLSSGADPLSSASPITPLGLTSVAPPSTVKPIVFIKIPGSGIERVQVTGVWKGTGADTLSQIFLGTSNPVKILPGDPAKVAFQSPPSKINSPGSLPPVIDPGTLFPVTVEVRDQFDNPVTGTATVTIKSNNPTIGDIDGPTTATTDSIGVAKFNAKVTTGDLNQTFELEASIPNKPSDKADLKVGKARDRLWILYGDAAKYDAGAELRGTAGQRLPVTIRAGKDADTKLTERQTDVVVTGSTGLAIYAAPTDANPTSAFKLTNGEVVIYVTGLRAVDNGYLNVDPAATDNTILSGTRSKIYFTFTPSAVQSASFHADNGQAAVDRVEIAFRADLKRAPDSIALSWPAAGANAQLVKTGITWNAASPRQVTVKLATPFPAGLSSGTGAGTVYTFDPTTPEIPVQAMVFTGVDSVGPLLDSGVVLEKLNPGQDTLFIGFNEKIDGTHLTGASLQLIKPGAAPVVLTILSADEIAGKGWRITLADLGAQAPAPGDSLKINAAGPLTDALGNHAHPLNRAIALKLKNKPRPAVLEVRFDNVIPKVNSDPQAPDFVIFSGSVDSTWTPVMGSTAGRPAQDCHQLACGGPVQSVPGTGIDRPALTLETDRAIQYSVTIFDNLGEFVNGFTGEITNAQLGLDERNLPVTGAASLFNRGPKGKFTLKIGWNAKSNKGSRAGTGVYVAKVTAVSAAEDGDGKAIRLAQSQAVRFGLMRN